MIANKLPMRPQPYINWALHWHLLIFNYPFWSRIFMVIHFLWSSYAYIMKCIILFICTRTHHWSSIQFQCHKKSLEIEANWFGLQCYSTLITLPPTISAKLSKVKHSYVYVFEMYVFCKSYPKMATNLSLGNEFQPLFKTKLWL